MTGGREESERSVAACIVSLLAGVWMLAAGAMYGGWHMGSYGGMGWMWGHGMMGGLAAVPSWWPWLGVAAGVAVVLAAVMACVRPRQSQPWGIVILVASVANLFAGMGGFLASALGILGGALAVARRPE